MKTQTALLVAGSAAVGFYLWQRSKVSVAVAQPMPDTKPAAKPAKPAPILPRRSTVTTAPVPMAKPVAVKNPSTASRLLSAGASAAAQFGCSHLSGFQKDICLQGTGIVANGSVKLW